MLKNTLTFLKKPAVLQPLLVFWTLSAATLLFSIFYETAPIELTGAAVSSAPLIGRFVSFLFLAVMNIFLFFLHIAVIAGISSVIKSFFAAKNCSLKEFFSGVLEYYEKVMPIFFSILGMLILYLMVMYFIQKILDTTGIISSLQSVEFGVDVSLKTIVDTLAAMLVVCLTSPFFASWIPAVILDDIKLSEGFRKSLELGWQNYIKLFFVACIYYLPSVLYFCIAVIYDLIRGADALITSNVFFTFVALEKVANFTQTVILSIVVIYLFFMYMEIKSGVRHKTAGDSKPARV